jgi:lysophospholipase L1-like esterase
MEKIIRWSRCARLLRFFSALCVLSSLPLRADSPPVRVACVGDSITFGVCIQNWPHDSYPAMLGRLLGTGWDVRNFGVSGATMLTKSDLPYVKQKPHDDAVAFAPDIVVIMLGTNDSKHRGDGSLDSENAPMNWSNKADFVPDYEAMIAEFRKANPAVKVYLCLPTPCFPGRWGINEKTIHDEVIPLIRQVAKSVNASIIDLNSPFAEKKNLFPDTVHPNAAGAGLMAATVYQALTGNAPPIKLP